MEGGRAPAARSPAARWRRRTARVLRAAVGLTLVPCLLAPLLLRGFVLRWAVARATRDLCGAVTIDDGRLGWTLVPDLLFGRPIALELFGLRVVAPDGSEALAAARVSGRVDVSRHPWRVVVDDAVVTRGRWRLAVGGARGSGFLDAFRGVPAGATRAACVGPPSTRAAEARSAQVRAQAKAPATRAADGSLVIRELRLDEVDVDLDFPVWGLTLPHVRALGSLAVGPRVGNGLLFDVRDARAPGGTLRAGLGGDRATGATTTAHFDDVLIAHVGVSPDSPADLALALDHAATGRSRLAGTAVFENVFVAPGPTRATPGLSLDARWEHTTDAARALTAPWLPRATLGELLDGTMTARVRGPFLALTGALSIEGPHARVEATVERGARATLDARAEGLDLEPMLDARLAPMFGGRITGRLRAELALVAGLRDVDAKISEANLSLTRSAGGLLPRTFVFDVGPSADADAVRVTRDRQTLALGLTSARLRRRALRLEGLRARWAELAADGEVTLTLPPRAAPTDPPRLDAKLAITVGSLARWISPATASGRVAVTATIAGPLDRLRAALVFGPSTTVKILGERFTSSAPTTATFEDGRVLTLDRLALQHVGGGTIEARGRAARAGPVAAELRVVGYPLAALPGTSALVLPLALRAGTRLRETVAGTVDATLKIAGTMDRPRVEGTLALAGVALAGRAIGDGRFDVHAADDTLAGAGTLGPSLSVDGTATRGRRGVALDATVKLRDLALGPWLPPPCAGLDVAASGRAHVSVAPDRPTTARAELHLVGLGSALDVTADAAGAAVTGQAHGTLALDGLRPLWKQRLAEADGALDVAFSSTARAPLTGAVTVARTLHVRPRGWPLALDVAPGGRVDVDGSRLRTAGLDVSTDGARARLSGEVRVDADDPGRSRVDLAATGRLDAAAVARRLRAPALASASGAVTVDARVTGEARAPVATGEARFESLEVTPVGWSPLRATGVIDVNRRGLSTRALRVETVGAGALTIGRDGAPASVDIASWSPLELGRVDVPIDGRGLHVGSAQSALEVGALDLQLQLTGDATRGLLLAGELGVARARYDPKPAKGKPSSRAWYEGLPPRLTIDLTLRGPPDAVVVGVPHLPDVSVGFECHVRADAHAGSLTGGLRGTGAYSRFALSLYHVFVEHGAADVRGCHPFSQ